MTGERARELAAMNMCKECLAIGNEMGTRPGLCAHGPCGHHCVSRCFTY